jgi:hypothetical protein
VQVGRSSGLFVLSKIGGLIGLKPPGFRTHHIENEFKGRFGDE